MKKLLVTGASGFVGWHIAQIGSAHWELSGQYRSKSPVGPFASVVQMDLNDLEALSSRLEILNPDGILHLAAVSNPNFCERNQTETYHTNVLVTKSIGMYAEKKQIPFVFASSDLVFSGNEPPYTEDSEPNPINQYGWQKMQAEQVLQEVNPGAIIARLPLMYGIPGQGSNFLANWLESWRNGKTIPAFKDEFRTGASGYDVAKGIFLLLEKGQPGIYHLGGRDCMSRYQFAKLAAAIFGLPFQCIKPSFQKDVIMDAKRPANVALVSKKANALGYEPLIAEKALLRLRDKKAF